jgi:hypothetical protein
MAAGNHLSEKAWTPGLTVVLTAVVEYGELPAMLGAADVLRAALQASVRVLFAKRVYHHLARDTAEVIRRGHGWLDWSGAERQESAPQEALPSAEHEDRVDDRRGAPHYWRALAGDLRGLVRDYRAFRRRYADMECILREQRPSLVLVGQDLIGKELSFLLIAARRLGIPTVILPFAMFSVRELAEYAVARTEHHVHGRPLNPLLAAWYPHWTLEHEGHRLVRFPASRALALEWSGLISGNPWAPCSEIASVVACESRVAKRGFASAGVPEARLRVIGSPAQDRLYAAVARGDEGRARLMRRHGLEPSRPLVVCGWPANVFAWAGGRSNAYPDYASLARAWAHALAAVRERSGVRVLVSVHPKTLDLELEPIRACSLPYQRGDSEETVAHCDLFVTLNGSSITAWAIACRKPVLLFDCYRTGYRDFDEAPGCVLVTEERAFHRELERLSTDEVSRQALASAQSGVASDWGELDGRSGERLASLCAELMQRTP